MEFANARHRACIGGAEIARGDQVPVLQLHRAVLEDAGGGIVVPDFSYNRAQNARQGFAKNGRISRKVARIGASI
jgi:hypothetical protein